MLMVIEPLCLFKICIKTEFMLMFNIHLHKKLLIAFLMFIVTIVWQKVLTISCYLSNSSTIYKD